MRDSLTKKCVQTNPFRPGLEPIAKMFLFECVHVGV